MNYVAIFLIVFIVIFVSITYVFFNTKIGTSKRFINYVQTLSVFSISCFVLSIIISLQTTQKTDVDKINSQLVKSSDKYWIELQRIFMDKYPYLETLYSQLYGLSVPLPTLTDKDLTESKILEIHVCNILFQIIENIIFIQKNVIDTSIENNEYQWTSIFVAWSKSQIFQDNWKIYKNFYGENTKKFIDGMIAKNIVSINEAKTFLREIR